MFNKGDIVRLRFGAAPMRVIGEAPHYGCYTLRYIRSSHMTRRNVAELIHYEEPNETEETKEETMTKLYETKEATPRFGTKLAVNSAGMVVLEMKGTGEVSTFKPEDIEEVHPYTVGIKFQDSSTQYHYITKKGAVKKGDTILGLSSVAHQFATVVDVDTKSDRATKELKGRKVMTEEI